MVLTLTLEIWGTDPLRGRVRPATGEEREFTGWLGLAQVLGEVADRGEPPRPAIVPVDR